MALIGFNFTKINVEKNKNNTGKVNISNNLQFTNINKAKINFVDKKTALAFEFLFTCKYEPKIGKIELAGTAIELLEPKLAEETLKKWKDKKQLPQKLMQKLLNSILNKCYVESIVLSNSINLPSPVPLPKVKTSVKNKKEETKKKK
jgi:hypothetical protein